MNDLKINGSDIIATFEFKGDLNVLGGRVILVDRGADSLHRYVVANQFSDSNGVRDSEWYMGRYLSTFAEALPVFFELARDRGVLLALVHKAS